MLDQTRDSDSGVYFGCLIMIEFSTLHNLSEHLLTDH